MRRILTLLAAMLMMLVPVSAAGAAPPQNFRTHLTGDEEVPAVETKAQGQAIFQVRADGTAIDYRLNVANIENVFMAHLHVGAAGTNGGIVVWLYPGDGPPSRLLPGRTNGTLATGTITGDDLVGAFEDEGLETLVGALSSGDIYVNVHTLDFPAGEIRGQID